MNKAIKQIDCPSEGDLKEFNSARLSLDRSESIAEHLGTCGRCVELLDTIDDGAAELREAIGGATEDVDVYLQELDRAAVAERIEVHAPPWRANSTSQSQVDDTEVWQESDAVKAGVFRSIGKYEVRERLGEGGMGVVHEAWDPDLQKSVAVKVIGAGEFASTRELEYFQREVMALGRMEHPNVVRVHYADLETQRPYVVMELLPGGSLEGHLDDYTGDLSKAVALVAKLAGAIHVVHEHGLLHRDLKPSNVLLDADGEPKVGDFGLATLLDNNLEASKSLSTVGTPPYMAPEQTPLLHAKATPATDIWALGVILYRLTTQRMPFLGRQVELFRNICQEDPVGPRIHNPKIDQGLEAVILKCLRKEPERRFRSATELQEELERWLRGEELETKPDGVAERTYRYARRYPIRSGVISIALAALLSSPFLAYHFHPDRPLWEHRAQLERGQAVELIGANGAPRWYEKHATEKTQCFIQSGNFHVDSPTSALIELFDISSQPAFELTAEVLHTRGEQGGEVGVFLLLQDGSADGGSHRSFMRIAFNDRKSKFRPPPGVKLPPGLPKRNPISFSPLIYLGRNPASWAGIGFASNDRRTVNPPPIPKSGWRQINVLVQDDVVTASFDGAPMGDWTFGEISDRVNQKLNEAGEPFVRSLGSGKLGLFVTNGAASFRNITVTSQR